MRLVIDLQSAQGESRQRGIGRQSCGLARALAADCRGHEVWLLLSRSFPGTIWPLRGMFRGLVPDERIVEMGLPGPVAWNRPESRPAREQAERKRCAILERLAPDVVHLGSLFEGLSDESVTTLDHPGSGWISSVTLHDLMPLIHPSTFITDSREREWYDGKVAQLRKADLWLAVSASSRREGMEYLGLPGDRVVNISSGADAAFRVHPPGVADRDWLLRRYGLARPFIMFSGGDSPQKNIGGLVRAYAALPEPVRRAHQLAIVCKMRSDNRLRIQALARELGLDGDDVVFTGYVSDANLVAFYNMCRLFVFPSWHEGFGLPVLEAMNCGAAVLGSDSTSVAEVIAWPDALFDPMDVEAMARKMGQALVDPEFHARLVRHGRERSRDFSWEKSAAAAWDAFESATGIPGTGSRPVYAGRGEEPAVGGKVFAGRLRPPALEPGMEYRVGGDRSFLPYLGRGWSNPEAWGIWSDGRKCSLLLVTDPKLPGAMVLHLEVTGFVNWRHRKVRIRISAGGRPEVEMVIPFWRPRKSVVVPLDAVESHGLYHVEIGISEPASPAGLGMGTDARELGLGLRSLRLERFQEAPTG